MRSSVLFYTQLKPDWTGLRSPRSSELHGVSDGGGRRHRAAQCSAAGCQQPSSIFVWGVLQSARFVHLPDEEWRWPFAALVHGRLPLRAGMHDFRASDMVSNWDWLRGLRWCARQMKETPLIRCAHNGHLQAVKLLMARGADVNSLDLARPPARPPIRSAIPRSE